MPVRLPGCADLAAASTRGRASGCAWLGGLAHALGGTLTPPVSTPGPQEPCGQAPGAATDVGAARPLLSPHPNSLCACLYMPAAGTHSRLRHAARSSPTTGSAASTPTQARWRGGATPRSTKRWHAQTTKWWVRRCAGALAVVREALACLGRSRRVRAAQPATWLADHQPTQAPAMWRDHPLPASSLASGGAC